MQPGEQFPDFNLPSSKGGNTRLSDVLDKSETIVGILPHEKLDAWLEAAQPQTVKWFLDDFANVYLVFHGTPDQARALADEHGIQFGFLCDVEGSVGVEPGFYRLDRSGRVIRSVLATASPDKLSAL